MHVSNNQANIVKQGYGCIREHPEELITHLGLCNQLFGVYSYAPVALLYNASLIVTDMHSRHTFRDTWPIASSKWSQVPFSQMFNFEHFAGYWLDKYNLTFVDKNDYRNCFNSSNLLPLKRIPDFWPLDDSELLSLIKNVSIPPNTPSKDRIYYIDAEVGFTTLYNFHPRSKQYLLKDVVHSLQPAPLIQSIINNLINSLPKTYVAAHFRLEGMRD